MRGAPSKADFDEFVSAVQCFPPTMRDGKTAQLVFQESYDALDKLADKKPAFPRAIAWKAYALALSVYEGWPLSPSCAAFNMKPEDRLDMARDLGLQAIGMDDTDYDLHWAMADVYLIRGEFPKAMEEFQLALYLNRDERHPSLFAEAASAMMQAGDFDGAERHFRKARTPDWHHWMRGTYMLLKAGRTEADRETFLNVALEELKGTRNQLGDDFYQSEIQLILAAAHWRKCELYLAKAAATTAPAAQALFALYAKRNMDAAARAIHTFQAAFPYWSEKQAIRALSLQDTDDQTWWQQCVKALWSIP